MGEAFAHPQCAPDGFCTRPHLEGVVNRGGHRLLDRDVLAGLERGNDMVSMQVGRGQHLHRVDRIVGQHGVQIGVEGRGAPVLSGTPAGILVGVAHRHEVAARILEIAPNVECRDVPRTDHPQSDLVR